MFMQVFFFASSLFFLVSPADASSLGSVAAEPCKDDPTYAPYCPNILARGKCPASGLEDRSSYACRKTCGFCTASVTVATTATTTTTTPGPEISTPSPPPKQKGCRDDPTYAPYCPNILSRGKCPASDPEGRTSCRKTCGLCSAPASAPAPAPAPAPASLPPSTESERAEPAKAIEVVPPTEAAAPDEGPVSQPTSTKMCSRVKCPLDQTTGLIDNADSIPCRNGRCSWKSCCKPREVDGNDGDATSSEADSNGFTSTVATVVQCKTFDASKCSAGLGLVKGAAKKECRNGKCNAKQCCQKPPTFCDAYTCNPAKSDGLIPDAADKECKNGKCNWKQCCKRKPKMCSKTKCPATWPSLIENAATVECTNGKCNWKQCCQKATTIALTCDSYTCNAKRWLPLSSPADVECAFGKCTANQCCQPLPTYCSKFNCAAADGFAPIKDAATTLCDREKSAATADPSKQGPYRCSAEKCCTAD